ncbi:hypothetical protein BS78_K230600 [Paspalum vaginatum]|uniref:Uncharacterized protein n=1 Tax=Paspalum vaginatum TaxID=158149 RepID=A0A9W7X7M0_9POAL|nr:hypothetical protein BS78_K230600 [Paspalum vaginatum]
MPNDPSRVVKVSHFIHAHFLRKDTQGKYYMTYRGCDVELPLPAPQFKLYSVRTLTVQLEPAPAPEPEPARNSVARVMTRAQRHQPKERLRKAYEEAQEPGAEPAWTHPGAGPSRLTQEAHPLGEARQNHGTVHGTPLYL